MHPALRVALGHLLMEDAAARRHPLHVAGGHLALIAQAVTVLDRSSKHIRDRLDPAMRMPGESCEVVFRMIVAKVVQQQEWIEFFRFAEAENALQLHAA